MTHKDPICGMTGTLERHGQWFCSERCAEQYAHRRAATDGQGTAGGHHAARRWLFDPWVWVPASAVMLIVMGRWAATAQASAIYVNYLQKTALPFLLGLVIGGFVDHFVPREYIVKLLSGPRKRVIVRSTFLGFLASTCSHGCLALTMELYRKGASTPAAISFLLASPWASMALTLVLLSLFGLKGAVIVVCSLAIALATGLIFQQLDRRGLIDANPRTLPVDPEFSIRRDIARRTRQYRWTARQLAQDTRGVVAGMIPLGRMVMGWFQLGLVMSALIGALVPEEFFGRFLGASAGGLLLTLLIATVVEVCSEGTAPLAFELFRHTGALGNAFAFLSGGVVTDYTELGAVWTNIGRRTVCWMLLVTMPLVLGMGALLNLWR